MGKVREKINKYKKKGHKTYYNDKCLSLDVVLLCTYEKWIDH